MLRSYSDPGQVLEACVNEAGRGCLAGPVVAAAVIWNPNLEDDVVHRIKDSKKISATERQVLRDYIKTHAISYGIGVASNDEIDDNNILRATLTAMHRALDDMHVSPDTILVDGNVFRPYKNRLWEDDDDPLYVNHVLCIKGDATYTGIAAASILAKTHHDDLVRTYVDNNPSCELYDWKNNMCYGTQKHIQAIHAHGTTPYHRKSFRIHK